MADRAKWWIGLAICWRIERVVVPYAIAFGSPGMTRGGMLAGIDGSEREDDSVVK